MDAKSASREQSNKWLIRSAQIFLSAWVLFYLACGAKAAFWFDGYAVNGPFQIFDPLRRIAAGQVGGRDFVFFHGIGIPYLHYPLFKLFGGHTLAASELSRQWTSLLLFACSLGAFTRATFGKTSRFWIAAAASVAVMETLYPMGAAPGHSLISLRSTMPIFGFAVLQLRLSKAWKAVAFGLCMAMALAFGTEHGISLTLALLAVVVFSIAQSILTRRFSLHLTLANVRFAAIATSTAVISAGAILLLLCGPTGVLKALHYNLVELPQDQFWFFGSPPMPFFSAWKDLLFDHHVILCFAPTCLALAVLAYVFWRARKTGLQLGESWHTLALLMLVYGILTGIPLLGMLSKHYVFPLTRTLVLVALLLFADDALPGLPELSLLGRKNRRALLTTGVMVSIFSIVAVSFAYRADDLAAATLRHVRSGSALYSRFLDARWNSFMSGATRVIDQNRQRPELSLWSAYGALLESHYGVFPPAEDYIIHALGPDRWDHYLATFRKTNPEFVTTPNPDFSFEEWLQNEHWEFFEDLLNNYAPLRTVEHATIWYRKNGPWVERSKDFTSLAWDRNTRSLTLPAISGDSDHLIVVRIRYTVMNPWKRLPLVGLTPRYLVNVEGSPRHVIISFPPYLSEFEFPVQVPAGKRVTLRFETRSFLPHADFTPQQVEWKLLPSQPSNAAVFAPVR